MSLSDELQQLADLHQRGALSDDEFHRAKLRVLAGSTSGPGNGPVSALNALKCSMQDRWLGGVCGGLGELTVITSWLWRLGFVLLMFCAGTGLLFYGLLWLLVPQADPVFNPPPQGPARSN